MKRRSCVPGSYPLVFAYPLRYAGAPYSLQSAAFLKRKGRQNMAKKANQYYIRMRSQKADIPCTEEQFHTYYRQIDTDRRRLQRRGECVCPRSEELICDLNCLKCPHRRSGIFVSVDTVIGESDGAEVTLADTIADPSLDICEAYCEEAEMKAVLKRLTEIMPEAIRIAELRSEGMSDEKIAEIIGIKRKTFTSRIESARKKLRAEFPDFAGL